MQVGDIVNARFLPKEITDKDGKKYLDLKETNQSLNIYFSDYEAREFD